MTGSIWAAEWKNASWLTGSRHFKKFCVGACDGSRSYVALWNRTNKLIKFPWLSFIQQCAEVDRHELICVALAVVGVGGILEPLWIPSTLSCGPASTAELRWTMGCCVTVGSGEQTAWVPVIESSVTAPAVTASDKPPGAWIMYAVGLSDGLMAGRMAWPETPVMANVLTSLPANIHTLTYHGGDVFNLQSAVGGSPERCFFFRMKLFCFPLKF